MLPVLVPELYSPVNRHSRRPGMTPPRDAHAGHMQWLPKLSPPLPAISAGRWTRYGDAVGEGNLAFCADLTGLWTAGKKSMWVAVEAPSPHALYAPDGASSGYAPVITHISRDASRCYSPHISRSPGQVQDRRREKETDAAAAKPPRHPFIFLPAVLCPVRTTRDTQKTFRFEAYTNAPIVWDKGIVARIGRGTAGKRK